MTNEDDYLVSAIKLISQICFEALSASKEKKFKRTQQVDLITSTKSYFENQLKINNNLISDTQEIKEMPKEGSISRRKDGRYEAKLYVDGVQKTIACRVNYKEVLKILNETVKQKRAGKLQIEQKKKLTLYGWLDSWLTDFKKFSIQQASWNQIEICCRLHIKPHIPDCELQALSILSVQKGLNAIESGRMREYSKKTLFEALHKAQDLGYIKDNPCKYVEIKKHVQKEGNALSTSEEKQFLQFIEESTFKDHYTFYLNSGCRPHEIFLIKKTDVDMEKQTISVPGTKTTDSKRTIPIFKNVGEIIQRRLQMPGETLFDKNYDNIKKDLARLRSKIPFKVTLKDFRTTFGTRCSERGINKETIKKWLGHTTSKTTEKFYIKILSEQEKSEKNKFDFD